MADDGVLDTGVTTQGTATEAAGLAAPIFDRADITPSKVLWHAVQYEEAERKRNQAVARKTLSDINNIKINGWVNHLDELRKDQDDLYQGYVTYMSKYHGKTPEEFDPRNPQQAKEALELQTKRSQLENKVNISEQVKQWHQHDANLRSSGNEDKIDADSAQANADFYNQPLSKAQDYLNEHGDRPMLQQAYPQWKSSARQAASALKSAGVRQTIEADGKVVSKYDKRVAQQDEQDAFHSWVTETPDGQYAVKKVARENPNLTGDEILAKIKQENWDVYVPQAQTAFSERSTPEARKLETVQEGNFVKRGKYNYTYSNQEKDLYPNVTTRHTIDIGTEAEGENKPLDFSTTTAINEQGQKVDVKNQTLVPTKYVYITLPDKPAKWYLETKQKAVDKYITEGGQSKRQVFPEKTIYLEARPNVTGKITNTFGGLSFDELLKRFNLPTQGEGTPAGAQTTKTINEGGQRGSFKGSYTRSNGQNITLADLKKSYSDAQIQKYIEAGVLK